MSVDGKSEWLENKAVELFEEMQRKNPHLSWIEIDELCYKQAEEDYMRANVIENFKPPIIEQEEVVTSKQIPKRNKEKVITDLESQNFLLESVFRVKK